MIVSSRRAGRGIPDNRNSAAAVVGAFFSEKKYCARRVNLIPISVLKNARFWTAARVLSLKVVPWEDKSEGQTKRKE